jgi:hypothetical protein
MARHSGGWVSLRRGRGLLARPGSASAGPVAEQSTEGTEAVQLRLVLSYPWGVDRSELAAIASQKGSLLRQPPRLSWPWAGTRPELVSEINVA